MNRISALFLVLLVSAMSALAQPAKDGKEKKRKPAITIGRDTTYVEGPIDKDGYPDYEAALNERLSEGVTAENNANVLFFKAMGPHPEGANIPDAFFKWMKIKAPPEKGDYFVGPGKYVKARFKGMDQPELSKQMNDIDELQYQLRSRPWTAKEHTDVADWLKQNDKPLAVVIEASKRPRYYYPLVTNAPDGRQSFLIGAQIPGVQKSREFANALTVRAMLRVGEKKYDDAWQDLLACHRLGRLVGQGGTLIESLVGIAMDHIASDADLTFLEHAKLDVKQVKKCLADLQKLPPMPSLADKVGLTERFTFLQAVCLIDRDGPEAFEGLAGVPPGKGDVLGKAITKTMFAGIQWDGTLKTANQLYNRMAGAMRLKDRDLREKQLRQFELDIRAMKGKLLTPEEIGRRILLSKNVGEATGKYVGDLMICLLVPAVMKVQFAADRTEQVQSNLHIAFALAAYSRDNGKYPKTLDALVPNYLASIPNDIFSNKALIYRPDATGYLFYSVGINGRDDGGRGYDDEPPGDDLRVRMPRQK